MSRYVEGDFVYNNTEAYVQDNWKVNDEADARLRRAVRAPAAAVRRSSARRRTSCRTSGSPAQAPLLYVAGCANGACTCTGTNRQAMNPVTGQFLGPNSTLAIGTLVPNSGNPTNGLFLSGQGIAETTYTWPALGSRRASAWPTT